MKKKWITKCNGCGLVLHCVKEVKGFLWWKKIYYYCSYCGFVRIFKK